MTFAQAAESVQRQTEAVRPTRDPMNARYVNKPSQTKTLNHHIDRN